MDDQLLADTDLRIALRVDDERDSNDVVGVADAAALPRDVPGRAIIRSGRADTPETFQVAHSSGVGAERLGPMTTTVRPYLVGRRPGPLETRLSRDRHTTGRRRHGDPVESASPTDLERLVAAIRDASAIAGTASQRSPAPPPLPARLAPIDLVDTDDDVDESSALAPVAEAAAASAPAPIGLVDVPDEQRLEMVTWDPRTDGGLAVYGIDGAGTTTAALGALLAVAEALPPTEVHVYCIDADAGRLHDLAGLPHVGAVVGVHDIDRIVRLVAVLTGELERRRSADDQHAFGSMPDPTIVVAVDDVGSLRQALDDRRDVDDVWPALERILRDGAESGIVALLTAEQERAIPTTLAGRQPRRLVGRLDVRTAYAGFGLRPSDMPRFVPGRFVQVADATEVQLVDPGDVSDRIAAIMRAGSGSSAEPGSRHPRRVDPLPDVVDLDHVVDAAVVEPDRVVLPVGIGTRTGAPLGLDLPLGEHAIVAGAARTGRSTVLVALAELVRATGADLRLFGVAPRRSPLRLEAARLGIDLPNEPADVAAWVDRILGATEPALVLVDDADRIGGPSLDRLGREVGRHTSVVVAGRTDQLRSLDHWTRPLLRQARGVLIRPGATDAELLGAVLPRRRRRLPAHHGLVVADGELTPVRLADVKEPERAR
ncbi:MAG: FtsK/SpoIIIE domain-containing protein [Actinomycetota bacterium]